MGAPISDPNRTIMAGMPSLDATVTIKPVQCPVCKTFNPAGMMFCQDCGLIFDRALPGDAFGAPAVQVPVFVDENGREYPIRPGANSIGREGDIAINDAKVSRRHAELEFDGGVLTLTDVGSTNGTKVNDETLSAPIVLAEGDRVAFGGVVLQLRLPGGVSASATTSFASNRTAAIAAPPTVAPVVAAVAYWVGEDLRIPLGLGEHTFGRKSDNVIAIADPYVSGRHGVVNVSDDGITLTDTGSTNGTLVDGERIASNAPVTLTDASVIRLGSLEFRIERSASPE